MRSPGFIIPPIQVQQRRSWVPISGGDEDLESMTDQELMDLLDEAS